MIVTEAVRRSASGLWTNHVDAHQRHNWKNFTPPNSSNQNFASRVEPGQGEQLLGGEASHSAVDIADDIFRLYCIINY